jgi:hypothetical protein
MLTNWLSNWLNNSVINSFVYHLWQEKSSSVYVIYMKLQTPKITPVEIIQRQLNPVYVFIISSYKNNLLLSWHFRLGRLRYFFQ